MKFEYSQLEYANSIPAKVLSTFKEWILSTVWARFLATLRLVRKQGSFEF